MPLDCEGPYCDDRKKVAGILIATKQINCARFARTRSVERNAVKESMYVESAKLKITLSSVPAELTNFL